MSTFKKLLALTLALAMVLSVSAFAGSYKADTYKDAAGIDEDCEDAIELLYALDIMTGDNNGNFNPTATITRAEIAKMIYVILNYGKDDKAVNYTGAKIFSDVVAGAWYEGYVNYAATTKLVQGRGNGTFGPNDPVTCAEAAKMLLTAIGYSAEVRGYTGANWDKNVLSDAAIIGLLKGYKYNTNTYAPRQWVAVMFENALLDALTFDTMRPGFSGLLISGNAAGEYDTMGGKYYGLDEYTGIAIATANASIDYYEAEESADNKYFATADTSWVLFDNGEQYRSTGLGAMDLGQEYRVIYSTASDKAAYDGTAYSCRATGTSVVAEARTMDMEVNTKYGTFNNVASNKYVFTVEDMEANFNSATINALYTGTDDYADGNSKTGYGTLTAKALREMIEDRTYDTYARNNDLYKVIDADGDGDIDYAIVTEFAYAQVSKVGEHNKYGEYIKANKALGGGLDFNGNYELYLEDTIITEDEIAEDDFVKYTWDLDEGMFVMEVLPEEIDAEYEARDIKAGLYDIGGTEYQVADKGWYESAYEFLNGSKKLGKEVCIAYDGDLIVALWQSDDSYTDMADINKQLVLVTDARGWMSSLDQENRVISYLTIDGELHKDVPYQNHEDGVNFSEINKLRIDDTDSDNDYTDETFTLKGRLFILHEGSKGRVWLEALNDSEINDQLSAATSLLNHYEERDPAELNAKGSTVKLDDDKMVGENAFFYAYIKSSNGEPVFTVITPDEFGKGSAENAYAQVLTYTKASSGRVTVLGGYIAANLESKTSQGYLYITEILKESAADGVTVMAVMDGATDNEAVKIAVDDYDYLMTDVLYGYTYDFIDGDYDLTIIDEDAGLDWEKYVQWYDEEVMEIKLSDVADAFDLDDQTVAILTIDAYRDDTKYDDDEDDDWLYTWYNKDLRSIEFVQDLTTITEADIVYGEDTDSYMQWTLYYYDTAAYDGDGMLYIVVIRDMELAHPDRELQQ